MTGFSREAIRKENVSKIEIVVSGPCGCGKSSVMQSIKEMLESHNYAVVCSDRGARNNPEDNIENAEHWLKPHPDQCVFVLSENTNAPSAIYKWTD